MPGLTKNFEKALRAARGARRGASPRHPKRAEQVDLPDVTITLTRTTDGSNAPKVFLFPKTNAGDKAVRNALYATEGTSGRLAWDRSFPQGVGRLGEYAVVLMAFVGPNVETWGPALLKDVKKRLKKS